jgi:hypothetical protein
MKTTLAILGIMTAAALVAGTFVVADSYARISFQNNYNGAQNNQNSKQSVGIGQSNNVGGGSHSTTAFNHVSQTNAAAVSQSSSQTATNNCNGAFSC